MNITLNKHFAEMRKNRLGFIKKNPCVALNHFIKATQLISFVHTDLLLELKLSSFAPLGSSFICEHAF